MLKDENGEMMVEAVIVVVTTIMVIFIMMNLLLCIYQGGNVTATANQAATDVANIYSFQAAEPFVGYVDKHHFKQKKLYRYLGFIGNTELDKKQKEKLQWYTFSLLNHYELFVPEPVKGNEDDVQVEIVKSQFGGRQVHVTIERQYSALAVNPLRFFGLDPKYTCNAEGFAMCYDMIDYINNENSMGELRQRISGTTGISAIESLCGIFEQLIEWLE